MPAALIEQTKRIQLIYHVDNTVAKINITLNDTHDLFFFFLVQCQFQDICEK